MRPAWVRSRSPFLCSVEAEADDGQPQPLQKCFQPPMGRDVGAWLISQPTGHSSSKRIPCGK